MKKVSLILLVIILLCTLVSCNGEPRAKLVDTGVISYNGSLYYLEYAEFSTRYHCEELRFFDADPTHRRIKANLPLCYAAFMWQDYFGDNVIMVDDIVSTFTYFGPSYYFKEGFEFPRYNEVNLSRIVTEFKHPESTIEFPEDKDVTWKDIIDYDSRAEIENLGDHPYYFVIGELRDYPTNFYTTALMAVVVDDVAYMGIRHYDTPDEFYKITDEYQDAFLELVELSEQ